MSKGKVINFREKVGNRVLITHDDLDGVGCAIIYNKCFPNATIILADNNEVDDVIHEMIAREEMPVNCHLMISDLGIKQETIEFITNSPVIKEVELIDHHASAVNRMQPYPWALVNTKFCAAKLMYDIFKVPFEISDYEDFIELVNDYDTWGGGKGPLDESRDLTELLYFIGYEAFMSRFNMVSNVRLTTIEQGLLDIANRQKQDYLDDTIKKVGLQKDAEGNTFGIVYADKYKSDIGHYILEAHSEIEYVVILDYRREKVSLRSRGKVDVGKLCTLCGGGGHPRAAGFTMSENINQKYFTKFSDLSAMEESLDRLTVTINSQSVVIDELYKYLKRNEDKLPEVNESITHFIKEGDRLHETKLPIN